MISRSDEFGPIVIIALYASLQKRAWEHSGIDYLQVFEDPADPDDPSLWFIDDETYVTALLTSDYSPACRCSGLFSLPVRASSL